MRSFFDLVIVGLGLMLVTSCSVYRQNIMLQAEDYSQFKELVQTEESFYAIQPYDKLGVKVFSNAGEIVIDPDKIYSRDLNMNNVAQRREELSYTVQDNGYVILPMLDSLFVVGMTTPQLNNDLGVKYSEFYEKAFVQVKVVNRRVVVLSSSGSNIVELENEGMNLLEVLALSGVLQSEFKAHNIRLIRGDLKDPQVQEIDLSTLEGMQMANLSIQPGDVVYVEPVKNVLREALGDVFPVVSLISSLVSLGLLFVTINNLN